MIRWRLSVWFLLTLLAVSLSALPSSCSCLSCSTSRALCGPQCLLAVCHKFGIQASIEELTASCGYDGKNGTTMLGLVNGTTAKGLQAVGVKIAIDELACLKIPAIAYLWGNHFVVVEAGNADTVADTVMVTDPPREPVAVSKADFRNGYSGFAVLIANDASLFPKSASNGSDLRMDGYTWDFGSVLEGDRAEHTFKFRNVGNADLVISKADTSCADCLLPVNGAQTVPAGCEGEIRAILDTANQRGRMVRTLYLNSNDPVSPVVQLSVTGYVRPSQVPFLPRTLNFGSSRRTAVNQEVLVQSSEEDQIVVNSVSSNSPHVTAELCPSTDKDRPGYVINAALKPGAPIGEFKSTITINSNHPKQPKVEVPVTATIRGDIDLDRDSFFLGLVKKGSERQAALTISTVAPSTELRMPLKIDKIDCSLSYVSVEVTPKTEGKAYVLTATLKPDAPLGTIKGEVTIGTNNPDQPEIRVPVYAYVED